MEEIWKDVPGYEGLYQVNNLGKVKSLPKKWYTGRKYMITKIKILSPGVCSSGYHFVYLHKNNKRKRYSVHQLVAMAFLNHTVCGFKKVVDHINNNKLDNRVENLQIVTTRYNNSKRKIETSSKYTGVHWNKSSKRWRSSIRVGNDRLYLGSFKCELAASYAYQVALRKIELNIYDEEM